MSIELMKKLEDLRETERAYTKELSIKLEERKNNSIIEVRKDFERFFKEKGFSIISNSKSIKASYGKMNAILSHQDPSTNYMGVKFRFNIDFMNMDLPGMSIFLNHKEPSLSISTSFSTDKTREDKLKTEITETEESIATTKQLIEDFNNSNWFLFIKDDSNSFSTSYNSMYELLTLKLK